MVAKISGSLLLMTTFSVLGYSISHRFIKRHQELVYLQLALDMLANEIQYIKTPLPRIFEKISQRLPPGPLVNIFSQAALEMEQGVNPPSNIWQECTKEHRDEMCLSPNDLFILNNIGLVLEADVDSEGQARQIKLISIELSRLIEEASEEKRRNVKLWRYLGLLGGLAFVILFF